jgi:hypothetical protein
MLDDVDLVLPVLVYISKSFTFCRIIKALNEIEAAV